MQPLENFIAGRFVASQDGGTRTHVNPSRLSEAVSVVPRGSAADAVAAVDAAAEALGDWRRLTGPARAELLHKWAAAIAANAEDLALTLVREVGKPLGEARGEVGRCVVILRYYASEAVRAVGEVIPPQVPDSLQFSLREPLGVVALITPWNFPLAIPLWKAAPALALGNTVVLKASEFSSLTAQRLAQTALDAGLPRGVFNVLLGEGPAVGPALLQSPQVRAVSFTGSVATGARVAAVAAERNIRYQLEMGGKNVAIVLPDADLDRAATLTAAGAARYAGQKCTATSRVVVDSKVRDRFLDLLGRKLEELPLGPPDRADCAVGPLIHEQARDRVLAFISEADGARVSGGKRASDSELSAGNFIAPALIADVDPQSRLAQEEIFGPVVVSLTASDVDEAIEIANATQYGLSASLFTTNLGHAIRYISRIEAGMVRVNADTTGVDPHAPFGGTKASSSGTREQGPAAREFYTAVKTVQINS